MQVLQRAHLQKLVNESTILTTAEKQDWLDMLILMNDKQATELEDILTAEHPGTPPPLVAPPANLPAPAVPPRLAHISNLPDILTAAENQRTAPLSGQPGTKAPVRPSLKQMIEEKALPVPAQAVHKPVFTQKPQGLVSQPRAATLQPQPIVSTPPAQPKRVPTPAVHAAREFQLETLTDAALLSPAVMRGFDPADLLVRLQQLSKMEGYFNLLSYLEDSLLYKSYIVTGKQILSNQGKLEPGSFHDPELLSKTEFEIFADILRKIQIN